MGTGEEFALGRLECKCLCDVFSWMTIEVSWKQVEVNSDV